MHRPTKNQDHIRSIIQFAFFGGFLAISVNSVLFDLYKSNLPPVSLLGICPVGGVTALYILITTGTVVSFVTIAVVLLSLFFGSAFCGWVCPLGAFQDLVSKLTGRFHIKEYNACIPDGIDKRLRLIRYGMLILALFFSMFRITHQIREYCIYSSITGFRTGFAAAGGLIILALITAVTSVFIQRPWCKYLCPYGALLGMTNRFSFFNIRRKPSNCIGCRQCDNKCPMNIRVSGKSIIKDPQCIWCLRCISESTCPVTDTITLGNRIRQGITVSRKSLALVITVVFAFSISVVCFDEVMTWASPDGSRTGQNSSDEAQASLSYTVQSGTKRSDGEYEGLAVGYRPGLKVLVSIESDRITAIEIVSHRETRGYYEESFDLVPRLIIENQSTQVDSISGATETGDGIKKAVENALRKAGY
jgi:polyferredoxin